MIRKTSTLITSAVQQRFKDQQLKIGVLHAGGPAPGGNQVIFAAALRAMNHGLRMRAFVNGYEHLVGGNPQAVLNSGSALIDRAMTRNLRDQSSLLIGTSRVNPGKIIKSPADLRDEEKNQALTKVLDVFEAMRIGALISIGGDDTMRTANLLQAHYQNQVDAGRVFESFQGVVHVPKTIDKDYFEIDYTFGFMSAADFIGKSVAGFRNDAKAAGSVNQPVYHIVEIMGRAAGWLCAAASRYGQSVYTIVPEDYQKGGITIEELAKECVDVILGRRNQGKHYGVITIAEGLGDLFPEENTPKDEFGHTRLDALEISLRLKKAVEAELAALKVDFKSKLHAQKVGYAARQVEPNIFDVLLCQTLGYSAVDAILRGEFGRMISVSGVFEPRTVPFSQLVDSQTLKVKNWQMTPGAGLHQLMRVMQDPVIIAEK